jgi:large subunit ribosomal protein L35Ae
MKAVIVNFKGGRHTQVGNQMIIKVESVDNREKAAKLVGKEVVYTCQGKNKTEIKGTVKSMHGNSGALRVHFEKGMPGQSVGTEVKLQ